MSGRRVIVLPGRSFGPFVPQTFIPALAAMRRGADLVPVDWDDPDRLLAGDPQQRVDRVCAQVRPVLSDADPSATVVVAKSLGTYAAELVVELGLPAIWVTPLLTVSPIAAALARTSAPGLVAGGTADPLWDSDVAHRLPTAVLELPEADHGLFLPGPLADSVANLGLLARAAETLVAEVWPAVEPSRRPG